MTTIEMFGDRHTSFVDAFFVACFVLCIKASYPIPRNSPAKMTLVLLFFRGYTSR